MGDKYKLKNTTFSRLEDGKRVHYQPGDEIENLSEAALNAFSDNFELIEKEEDLNGEELQEIESIVDEYDVGNGWYELPGMDKKVHRDEAIEILENTEEMK